ncbi:hypothetical protein GCM10010992_05390 [Cloacibacterium rupense]|uniref:Uncharacterized protein n=2 Tax=Cloacibacterium rupense TaxID=517423 RepID=A0ABQ2NFM4_9FLAO|nr:hypothetical protein GCM10010992_05390 [Cloacibacterium rupense]
MNVMNINEKTIISLLKEGYNQKQISDYFKEQSHLRIGSQSSIEKAIKEIKKKHQVKTLFQLGMVIERNGI